MIVFKVALLKEAAAKKDAEIAHLQTFKERHDRGESGVGVEKYKSRILKPSARVRASPDVSPAPKLRMVQNESGSETTEVYYVLCEEIHHQGIEC